jgi:hypothetical protein
MIFETNSKLHVDDDDYDDEDDDENTLYGLLKGRVIYNVKKGVAKRARFLSSSSSSSVMHDAVMMMMT